MQPHPLSACLAAQVIYPLDVAAAVAREDAGGAQSDAVSRAAALDARLDGLMRAVRLSYLVEREGGWGAATEWGEVLSLGARCLCCALQVAIPANNINP